ncbi:quinolinate synthase NadA [Lysinibacillus sp. HST-98]|uniref:quinolinate synthase NadA n=1 Tax=Lysinibacillus TaxID=400634 RepID=UPI0001DA566D|nr:MULTISPECIES: quinolinate synthase NadA [Lysinibacillus]EFI69020.1 quinolinate synthetase [Lysinibacillus fusiformis ZC1]MBL3732463.1 quinolinate synthase NadA [Lysinibacillus sp. HST-98]MBU5253299.1 quinolinate synthase NadA [Lysinibacillus capsici]MED4699024.1 quinolinate synthase NadA [Lysinibacillus capsici]
MSITSLLQQTTLLPEHYRELSVKEMESRILSIKKKLGPKLFIPGHHYQKDEVIQFADATGDSLQLAQISAANKEAEHIVFCGVHFMAETADMLTTKQQHVYLPDMRAGCSMADMADIYQTEQAWPILQELFGNTIIPLTYVNSTAAIKAFTGRHGGACVTSSNAKELVQWAFTQKQRIFFLPDQHLGRNTAYDLGIPLENMAVWNPHKNMLETKEPLENIQVILWKGHCSVHEGFTVQHTEVIRKEHPAMRIIVHPECSREVVAAADDAGSTKYIIDTINRAPSGSAWAIGTEMNLVNRIIKQHPDKHIVSLNENFCPCLTMNRIDLPHLLWSLESIEQGQPHNRIQVDEHTTTEALSSLDRMLARG